MIHVFQDVARPLNAFVCPIKEHYDFDIARVVQTHTFENKISPNGEYSGIHLINRLDTFTKFGGSKNNLKSSREEINFFAEKSTDYFDVNDSIYIFKKLTVRKIRETPLKKVFGNAVANASSNAKRRVSKLDSVWAEYNVNKKFENFFKFKLV
jgi:hypothetical protein